MLYWKHDQPHLLFLSIFANHCLLHLLLAALSAVESPFFATVGLPEDAAHNSFPPPMLGRRLVPQGLLSSC